MLSAALFAVILLLTSCGDTFRPVAIPITKPGGDPQPLHSAVVLNANSGADIGSLELIDVSGDTVSTVLPTGHSPVHAAVIGGGLGQVYVANLADNTVSVLFPSFTVLAPSTITLPSGSHPVFLASTQTSAMYVVMQGNGGAVGVLSNSQHALVNTIGPVGTTPVALAETPDGTKLYCINQGSNDVTAINPAAGTVTATIPVGASPSAATISPDGSTLYVVNAGGNSISVIATFSNAVATIPVGTSPSSILFDSKLNRLYVTNSGSNDLSVFDVSTPISPVLLKTVTVGTNPVSVTALSDGTRVYVANKGSNNVSVVDSLSLSVRTTITVGSTPVSVSASLDSTKVFVANQGSGTISDIRTADDTVVVTIPAQLAANTTGSAQPGLILIEQ